MFKDFFVSMQTGLGKLLMAGTLISLAACSGHQPYYKQVSTGNSYTTPNNVYTLLYNWGKHNAYSVPGPDMQRHEKCVFFALDTLQVGEKCDWYSQQTSARGSVFVAQVDSNTCTTLFNTVWYKNKTKTFQDRACLKGGQWKFLK
jgi:hypothetical protein